MTERPAPPPVPPLVSLTEDEFDARFVPILNEDNSDIWEFDQIKGEPTEHVWSVVETGDADHDALYALPGWHVVNVIGYNLTAHPWDDENIEAHLHTFESDPDDNDDNDEEDTAS